MKRQSLLSSFLILVLLFCSSSLKAVEAQNEMVKWIFADAELNNILSGRPYAEQQDNQARKRLTVILDELFKKSSALKIPSEDKAGVADCLAKLTLMQLITTQAFTKKLAKPEEIISDFTLTLGIAVCSKGKAFDDNENQKTSALSVNDLLLDFSNYYGKEVIVKGYIVYNDIGSYLFHSSGNMNGIFLNNNRLSRESKKYLMTCNSGCEVTLKVKPSAEDSALMKTAHTLSVIK